MNLAAEAALLNLRRGVEIRELLLMRLSFFLLENTFYIYYSSRDALVRGTRVSTDYSIRRDYVRINKCSKRWSKTSREIPRLSQLRR